MFFSLRASLLFALVFFSIAAASQTTLPAAVAPPVIAAKAYLLVDILSGQTLVAQGADEPREPASLTKLMTAYIAFRALKDKELTPSQMVTVSEKAWRAEGSRMFIEPKKAVSVDELLRGEIVQSGNDAAIALAEAVYGSEEACVVRMNYGFQFYDTVQLYQNGQSVTALKVWKGATDSVAAGFVADQYVTLPKGQAPKLKLTLEAVEPLIAPVTLGQRVGVVKVTLDDKPIGQYPLQALSEVEPAGFFGRMWGTVRLSFH